MDHRTAFVLPEKLDPRKAAPLTCAGITAFNAVRKAGVGKEKGDQGWLGVVGCGGLGQLGESYYLPCSFVRSFVGVVVVILLFPSIFRTIMSVGAARDDCQIMSNP